LLPIPALDGGRIVFVLAEVPRRKRINPKFERLVHIGGMLAIYTLTLVLVIQDVLHPIF
jgi:regulator of sigma E protease